MLTAETPVQQTDHFEWLNAIDFYSSYLDIIKGRLDALESIEGTPEVEKKKDYFNELLLLLKIKLGDIESLINAHLLETDMEPVFDNRLDRLIQSAHHSGVKERIEELEEDVNSFRADFNQFYVNCI
jgi:hypothetical protein